MADAKKLSIIAFSGDFDKLTATFTLATGAAAVGYEVNIFFTFWGLDAIKQKQGRAFLGSNWLTKLFGFMMGGLSATPTSRFNFLGAGPAIFRNARTMSPPSRNWWKQQRSSASTSTPARWPCTCSASRKRTSYQR